MDAHLKIRQNSHLLSFHNLVSQVAQEVVIYYHQICCRTTIFNGKMPLIVDLVCILEDCAIAIGQGASVVVVESIEK